MNISDIEEEQKKPAKPPGAAIIRSGLLKEDIIVVCDKKLIPDLKREYPGLVIYTPNEINRLCELSPDREELKLLHKAKKEFNGKIY